MNVSNETQTLVTLMPEKKPWFSLSWGLVGHWNWTGYFGEELTLLFLPRFEPQSFQHISSQCTDFASVTI